MIERGVFVVILGAVLLTMAVGVLIVSCLISHEKGHTMTHVSTTGAITDHPYDGPLGAASRCTRMVGSWVQGTETQCGRLRVHHSSTAAEAGDLIPPVHPRDTEVYQATTRLSGIDVAVDQAGNLVIHVVQPGAYTIPNLDGFVADLETARQHAKRFAQHPEAYAGGAPALPDDGHIVEFSATGWTIMHPLSCRPNLFNCKVNRAAADDAMGLAGSHIPGYGRYRISLDPAGGILVGDEITLDTDQAVDAHHYDIECTIRPWCRITEHYPNGFL